MSCLFFREAEVGSLYRISTFDLRNRFQCLKSFLFRYFCLSSPESSFGVVTPSSSQLERKESFSYHILAINILRKDLTGMPRSQLTPGVRRAGSVMGSSHQKVMAGAAEELSLKRKGGSGSLGLNYFRLLKLYVLPLYQTSLLSRTGGTWEPCSLCWLVTTSIRLLLVASPLDAPHSVQSWLPHFLLTGFLSDHVHQLSDA